MKKKHNNLELFFSFAEFFFHFLVWFKVLEYVFVHVREYSIFAYYKMPILKSRTIDNSFFSVSRETNNITNITYILGNFVCSAHFVFVENETKRANKYLVLCSNEAQQERRGRKNSDSKNAHRKRACST